jgi:epoxyqueuosine reductase
VVPGVPPTESAPASHASGAGAGDDRRLAAELRRLGLEAGLVAVGVASAEPFEVARDVLERRKAAGLHGGMQFTYRNPARSTDPARTLPSVRSLVVGALPYPVRTAPRPPGAQGRVARYAADDHYARLRSALGVVADRLRDEGFRAVVVADDNALVDRAAAHRAGLGWFGRSANLLVPGRGSWVVLGSVLTDAALPPTPGPVPDGCGTCTRCETACPTGAIVGPGVVDARRCLAWLVQAEGDFPEAFREALGDRVYGCDDCQEVCPPGRRRDGDASEAEGSPGGWVDLLGLLRAADEELLAAYGRWYLPGRDPRYLRRNALVALGNVGSPDDPEVLGVVERYRTGGDALLARHAAWAAARLAQRKARP